jgi:tetratricopeptide (TPR) repeat protein
MTQLIPPRRMLPRWRVSTEMLAGPFIEPAVKRTRTNAIATRKLNKASSLTSGSESWEPMLDLELSQWRKSPDVGTAADILSFAVYPAAREKLKEVASFLVKQPSVARSAVLLELANSVLDDRTAPAAEEESPEPASAAIHSLRERLRLYPNNPIALADLALAHASVGNASSARKALLNAWSLAPTNRHILRALARFFVHIGDPERAQRFLEGSPRISSDPWLMSALIAVGQITGRRARIVRRARTMVAEGLFPAAHISELAGSLATLDLESGDRSGARKLFETAVVAPTENVLAQLHWAHQSINKEFEMRPAWAAATRAFELRALESFAACDTKQALNWALYWKNDEPFSSRPAVLATFLLSLLRRYDDAAALCRFGLRSNPGDENLEQNLIYSLILSGELEEAATRLASVYRRSPSPGAMANVGCLLLAEGNPEGRVYYEKAVELFKAQGEHERAALALGFFADALRRAGEKDWAIQLDRAKEINEGVRSPAFVMLNVELDTDAANGSGQLLGKKPGAKLAQYWKYDPEANLLTVGKRKLL